VSDPGRGFADLADALTARFGAGVAEPWPDFEDWAFRVFEHQFATNAVYRAFAEGRRATPADVRRWEDIPAVPATAFKHLPLLSGDPARVERVFRTSGTTRGGEERGAHHVLSLGLYRAAALPGLRANLLPEGGRIRILSLIPPAERRPESSLATMMAFALAELGSEGSGTFTDADDGVDGTRFEAALQRAQEEGEPVLVAGTAFALQHWLEIGEARFHLAEGSRLMETGGFKGRAREVAREDLHAGLADRLGIPPERMVGEYGMTELLSQFWEPALRDEVDPRARPGLAGHRVSHRRFVAPPWVRTRILDPVSLEEVARGAPGLLCHVDLANAGSVAVVLTEDLGLRVEGGFRVLGRVPGAEPRGCSLALEELLGAGRD
jgi:hypothetical protein